MAAASDARAFRLLVLPGDGIGPEVTAEALRVARVLEPELGVRFEFEEDLAGGASLDAHGLPVTEAVVEKALAADAVLFGAVGGARWDSNPLPLRPETGVLRLRKALDLFANLRPARCYPELAQASSLKPELVADLDILIIRELTAGVYFGEPRGVIDLPGGGQRAVDTQAYTSAEVERVVRAGFDAARARGGRLCSVDKANVMETGAFWRTIASRLAADYPDVELSHMYADNCAMQLIRQPRQFDVIVTDNLFGDVLSDAAAMLVGSLGLLPSASMGAADAWGRRRALYEPVHGSAPDIAGRGLANPLAAILSLGMLLTHSLHRPDAGRRLDQAVRAALAAGFRTADLARTGETVVGTRRMTDAVLEALADPAGPTAHATLSDVKSTLTG